MTDDERLQALLAKAFAQAEAASANAAIAEHRERHSGDGAPSLSYEAMVPAAGGWQQLVSEVLPKLVYFLDCRGAKLPRVRGVFVSLFVGSALYFLEVEDVIAAVSAATGMAPAEMVRRWGERSVQ